MAEDKFPNGIVQYVTHSSFCLKEKAFELQTVKAEEERNPTPAEDTLDDSSSSYCTALCSLSDYSEAPEDETQTTCTDPPCDHASSEISLSSVAISGQTWTNSSLENTHTHEDLKTKQVVKEGKETSEHALSTEPPYSQNKVWKESNEFSSSPKITILNMNLININAVDANQGSTPLTPNPNPNPIQWDYFKRKKNAAQTVTLQNVGSLEQELTSNTILTRSKENLERTQEHSDTKPGEHPTTPRQSFRNALYKPGTEFKPEWEEQGVWAGKEQAELSLNTGNRKPPPSCTSTLTPNKSEILPRCYSKRLLATTDQHRSQSPADSQRLIKQGGQSVRLSTLLHPPPCRTSRQRSSSADDSKGKFRMATKVAGTTTEVRSLATLDYTRSSCPEADLLDIFNSTCWSSTQLSSSERDFYDWSKDVLSFKIPMIPTNNQNTSACSETSSFECIDVALENHEEVDRNAKTVPKRQIQLKRRDNTESIESQANENDVIPSRPSQPRDVLQRQHSTPAAFHQDSPESETKLEQKQKLQKSLSLDETSSKTKMASSIIKNVLTKRMQHEQNLQSVDVPDHIFCPIKADDPVNNIDHLTSCAKEECTESNKVNLATVPLLSSCTSSQNPALKTESQTTSSIKEHISVSAKILPKLITRHGFNPLLGGLGRMPFQGSGTEIAAYSEAEKEKLSPSKEASQGSGDKLSCDSAKGTAWNLSAMTSGAVGKQATLKNTPEECVNAQAAQKQHYVKDQPTEMQENPGERKESAQSPTVSAGLACSLGANTGDNVPPQSVRCNQEKDQESGKGELKPPGFQSVNMGIQSEGKVRAIAPVHVVRDMRSLVKNTYNLSFRGPAEVLQGLEHTVPGFTTAALHPLISRRENKMKGHKQDKKLHLPKPTPPLARDAVTDLASLDSTARECATKADSLLESNEKIPHTGGTKVSPVSAAQTNSCRLPKSQEAQDSLTSPSQRNVKCSNTNMKQTTCASVPITNACKDQLSGDTRDPESEKPKIFTVHQTQALAPGSLYCLPGESSVQQVSCKLSNQLSNHVEKDGHHTVAGAPSACILTVAPAPVFPSYFYKPNLLGYQPISPNMGAVSYVQGPVMLQTHPHHQPTTASGPAPLIKSSSVDGRLLSQPCTADGFPVTQESPKQMDNGDTSQKTPSLDTQPCAAFITAVGAEGTHGGASTLYPEMGGSQHVSNPRHLLLDPETGQCFYVDVPQLPQLPQRKMLFDPETCQYVEVVVPQQTLSSTVMTTPCVIPFPSLHIPAMYPPHCLPYVQTHHAVLPPPEP